MALNGYLSEFSLGEIFQLIENGEKTGILTIRGLFQFHTSPKYYLWYNKGKIIAAANRLDGKGLVSVIEKRGWLKNPVANQLYQSYDRSVPLGQYLKSKQVINSKQLRILFITQVMQQVCNLFKIDEGFFHFDPIIQPPPAEMTGLRKPATDLTLVGLRLLKNWTPLEDKLPDPTSGLMTLIDTQPPYPLEAEEWQVWEYARGKTSLKTIAQELQLPIKKVQQIVFRLIVVGLAEEIPMVEIIPVSSRQNGEEVENDDQTPKISHSFLDNLTQFLQTKTS